MAAMTARKVKDQADEQPRSVRYVLSHHIDQPVLDGSRKEIVQLLAQRVVDSRLHAPGVQLQRLLDAVSEWLQEDTGRVDSLRRLEAGWNGHGAPPPDAEACKNAKFVIGQAINALLRPSRINASAEGGVSLYWFGDTILPGGAHRRYAWVECDNEGGMVVLFGDRLHREQEPPGAEITPADVEQVLRKIHNFLKEA